MSSNPPGNKALTVGVWIIAICAICMMVYFFVPGVRARLDLAAERQQVQQVSDEIDEKAKEALKLQVGEYGLSVIQYAQENKNRLPPKGVHFNDDLAPYMGSNRDYILEPWVNPVSGRASSSLVLSYGGPETLEMDASGNYSRTTELAYKDYGDFRYTVFLDGHVVLSKH